MSAEPMEYCTVLYNCWGEFGTLEIFLAHCRHMQSLHCPSAEEVASLKKTVLGVSYFQNLFTELLFCL